MRRIDWRPLITFAVDVLFALALFGTLAALLWYFANPVSVSVGIP